MSDAKIACLTEDLLLRALDGELASREAWLVSLHLQGCESCREKLASLRSLSSLMAGLHPLRLPPEAAASFAARLDEEESRLDASPAWRRWFSWPLVRWQHVALCAAAILLVFMGLRMRAPHPAAPVFRSATAAPGVPPPVPRRQAVVVALPKLARAVRHAHRKRLPEKLVSSRAVAPREVTTPFFALPFSDAALPLDQATVIRVDLPRSALELTGLPVEEDRRNERVRADLVLGADGLARAIRFVQ